MKHECYACHLNTVNKLADKFSLNSTDKEFLFAEAKILLDEKQGTDNPLLAAHMHRLLRNKLNNPDPYSDEKKLSNKILLSEYHKWKTFTENSPDPFASAVKLSIAGNVIDYGAHAVKNDISALIEETLNKEPVINETALLREEIRNSESILFLGDNSGEIVLDKILIETINHPDLTYAVRGTPVINDITMEDALQTGMHNACKVISNGNDAPSTLLEFCSEEFLQVFNNAGLIISKGMGNFEGLMNVKNKNIFFLFMAKCNPIAGMMNVNTGDLIVSGNRFNQKHFNN